MGELIYGTGLRVRECVSLRVKDIDLLVRTIVVRSGKGNKDRLALCPDRAISRLRCQLVNVATLRRNDRLDGAGFVPLPDALHCKYPSASGQLAWQYVFQSRLNRRGRRPVKRCDGIGQFQP